MIPRMVNSKILLQNPATIATTRTINSLTSKSLLRVLLASGSRKTLIHGSALPKGIVTVPINGDTFTTLAGKMSATEMVTMRHFLLPEFDKNRRIEEHNALVFSTHCRCDIILGSYLLRKDGIKINY